MKRHQLICMAILILSLAACGGATEEIVLPTQASLDAPAEPDAIEPTQASAAEPTALPPTTAPPTEAVAAGDGPLRFTASFGDFGIVEVAFSPDGGTIALSADEMVQVVDAESGDVLNTYPAAGDAVRAIAFSPDGATIAYADRNDSVYLLDLASGEATPLLTEETLTGEPEQILFSPDGTLLAHSAGNNGRVQVVDLATGETLDMVERPQLDSERFIFSADGTQIFANDNEAVQVHDVATGELAATLEPGVGRVYGLATDSAGSQLFILGDDMFAVWDLAGNSLATSYELAARSGQRFAVSDDGTRMVVNLAGRVPVLDPMTGEQVVNLLDQVEPMFVAPFEMDISPDGTLLAHGALNGGNFWVWELPDA